MSLFDNTYAEKKLLSDVTHRIFPPADVVIPTSGPESVLSPYFESRVTRHFPKLSCGTRRGNAHARQQPWHECTSHDGIDFCTCLVNNRSCNYMWMRMWCSMLCSAHKIRWRKAWRHIKAGLLDWSRPIASDWLCCMSTFCKAFLYCSDERVRQWRVIYRINLYKFTANTMNNC